MSVGTIEEGRVALEAGAKALGIAHHMLDPHLMHGLGGELKHYGAGAIVRSPLCYGLLAGRWSEETKLEPGDHRSRRWDEESLAERRRQVEELRFLVKGDVPDLATAALRFALSSPFVATVCVGARTPEQIAHAARASRDEGGSGLADDDLARITKLASGAKL